MLGSCAFRNAIFEKLAGCSLEDSIDPANISNSMFVGRTFTLRGGSSDSNTGDSGSGQVVSLDEDQVGPWTG